MLASEYWVIALISCAACSFFCGTVAEAKSLSVGFWSLVGLLFGPIALIAVAGMPHRREIESVRQHTKRKSDWEASADEAVRQRMHR